MPGVVEATVVATASVATDGCAMLPSAVDEGVAPAATVTDSTDGTGADEAPCSCGGIFAGVEPGSG